MLKSDSRELWRKFHIDVLKQSNAVYCLVSSSVQSCLQCSRPGVKFRVSVISLVITPAFLPPPPPSTAATRLLRSELEMKVRFGSFLS